MSVLANSAVIGGEIDTGDIGHSLRFRSAASHNFYRTPSVSGNRKIMTFSFKIKRGTLNVQQMLFSSRDDGTSAGNAFGILFDASNRLAIYDYAYAYRMNIVTSRVFRDPTAAVDITVGIDTTQATASNRVTVEVNGVQETVFTTATYPAQNIDLFWNDSGHWAYIGRHLYGLTPYYYLDGYLSRACCVDGTKLTASAFGYFNSETNEWATKTEAEVKAVVNAGGANSFMLDFDNGTSLTTLGYDKSSKGNNWTLNNFSLTAGSTYDWSLDVPGNSYANFNSLDSASTITFSEGNMAATVSGTDLRTFLSQALPTSGKFYAELFSSSASNASIGVSFGLAAASVAVSAAYNASGCYLFYASDAASIIANGTTMGTASGYTNTANIPFKFAIDIDAGKAWLGQGSVWWNSTGGTTGDPETGANPTFSLSLAGYKIYALFKTTTSYTWRVNTGQRPFTYTPPTGFKALCQANLSDSGTVIVSGSFTGNVSADGPCVWMNGTPKTLTINSNAVTFGTHADRLATGFKIRTASTSYNSTGTNTWTATIDSNLQNIFKYNNGQGNS